MIVFWLLWNVLGAFLSSGAQVAYLAHLGGFAVGFAVALVMCKAGWLTMEKYEKSLLQPWKERRQAKR